MYRTINTNTESSRGSGERFPSSREDWLRENRPIFDMSKKEKTIESEDHGKRQAPFVCQHLVGDGARLGFNRGLNPDDPDELWPWAWCDTCDEVLTAEKGWNDRALDRADFHLVCGEQYDRARVSNWRQDHQAFGELMDEAVGYLRSRQAEIEKRFRLDEHPRWDWERDTGELVFSNAGKARVVADCQAVGSYSTESKSWMWSWANRSVPGGSRTKFVAYGPSVKGTPTDSSSRPCGPQEKRTVGRWRRLLRSSFGREEPMSALARAAARSS